MSALAEQHERWVGARERLWKVPPPVKKIAIPEPEPEPEPEPIEPTPEPVPAHHLFTRPIEELDDDGRVVVTKLFMPEWKRIALEVCAKHKVSFKQITSPFRSRETCAARHEVFWRLRHETLMSYPAIGRRFGGRDHTTVLHGVRKHEQRMREASNA